MRKSITYKLLSFVVDSGVSRSQYFKPLLMGIGLLTMMVKAQAPVDVRIALVIGNAAYVNVPALSNSTNDAKSMANILRKLGFKVVEIEDGSQSQMKQAIVSLQAEMKDKQAVSMLYYAGHGLQLDWHNYMVPVDARLNTSADVPKQTIDIESVIQAMKNSSTRMNIIVLDACRDNPFAEKASGKGLAQLDAPPGTYLAFATAPGNVAEDGDTESGNGLFTQYLIKELQKPATIENVFKRVRLQVRQKSQGRQIPWDSSSLEDDFAFNDGKLHTFNPEDLIREAREAKEKEERLKAEAEAAKQREIQIAQQREQEKIRLAQERKRIEQEAEAQRQRDIEIAQQREIERQKLAEAQKIKEIEARQKAEAQAKERERQLAMAAEEQKRKAQEAEQARLRAEVEAKEREKQLALALEKEQRKAQDAALALEKAKLAEAQRLKDIEQASAQAELETKLRKESADKQFEIQKAEWDRIKDSKNVDDFYAFLNKYPSGFITEQAQFQIEQLQKAKTTIQADKDGFIASSNEARYRIGDEYLITIKNNAGKEFKRYKLSVTKIEKGLVYLQGDFGEEVKNEDGATIKGYASNGFFEYDPPVPFQPGGEFKIGMKWISKSYQYHNNIKSYRVDEGEVLTKEVLETPIGTLNTFKIQIKTSVSGSSVLNTFWYEPGWGVSVKRIRKVYTANPAFRIDEVYEVIYRKKG